MAKIIEKAGLELVLMRDSDTDGAVTKQSQRVYLVARESGKEEI